MIGWLSGVVRHKDPVSGGVVLDVGGVGYQVHVSVQTLGALPPEGGPATLWIHTHVREDLLALYGFVEPAERAVFRMLLSVPQVGPKLALVALGGLPLADLLQAIASGDRACLQKIPGIGKRTAERILLDLGDKVRDLLPQVLHGEADAPAAGGDEGCREDAQAVLVNLGWKLRAVERALDRVCDELGPDAPLDDVVKRALVRLMGRDG